MFQKYTQLRENIEKILDSSEEIIKKYWITEVSNEIAEEIIMMIENKYWKIFDKDNLIQMKNRDIYPMTID